MIQFWVAMVLWVLTVAGMAWLSFRPFDEGEELDDEGVQTVRSGVQ